MTARQSYLKWENRMSEHAVFVHHQTLPGMREDVQSAWRRHLQHLISADPGFRAYFYCFGEDPDSICAFQTYRSRDAAAAFVKSPEFAAYYEEVTPLLLGQAKVTVVNVQWSKEDQ
jgi:quinol monooxygenase YgiN